MKTFYYIFIILFFLNCSTTRMVDSWVNEEYENYKPNKILVVGLTDNLTARKLFEEKLVLEFKNRNIDAVESYDVFERTFTSVKQTEENIEKQVEKLTINGFDAILISAVKGVNEKIAYTENIYRRDHFWRRFGPYYYWYQEVYFDPVYYEKYNIYNIEATLYDLNEKDDKSLIWVASYNIVDPTKIHKSVKDYVKAIIESLEAARIVPVIQLH